MCLSKGELIYIEASVGSVLAFSLKAEISFTPCQKIFSPVLYFQLLYLMVYFDQILYTYTFKYCLNTGMQDGDDASPTISPAGRGQLMKMFITLEPHGIF